MPELQHYTSSASEIHILFILAKLPQPDILAAYHMYSQSRVYITHRVSPDHGSHSRYSGVAPAVRYLLALCHHCPGH